MIALYQEKGICSLLLFGSTDSGKTALAKSYINLMVQPLYQQQNTPIDFYHIRPAVAQKTNLARLYRLVHAIKNTEGRRFTVIFIEHIESYLDPAHENIGTIAALKSLMDDTTLRSSSCFIAETLNPFKLPGILLDRMTMVETPLPVTHIRKSLFEDYLKNAMYCYSKYRGLQHLVKHTTGHKYRDLERLKKALKDVCEGFNYEAATSALCKSWPMDRRVPDELLKCMVRIQLFQAGIMISENSGRVLLLSDHLKTSTKKEITAIMYQIRDRYDTSSLDVHECIDEVLA